MPVKRLGGSRGSDAGSGNGAQAVGSSAANLAASLIHGKASSTVIADTQPVLGHHVQIPGVVCLYGLLSVPTCLQGIHRQHAADTLGKCRHTTSHISCTSTTYRLSVTFTRHNAHNGYK